ncbi:MAG TPA: site-specific DNA-methyltransferase, partial [Spirochaetes bacterium]|nr:site-specific DNA-methyltransferase [Spirochaetota bacterium]
EINILLKQTGFHFRNWIIWYYTFGQNQRKKFNRSHTHIFYFTKDKDKDNFVFNSDNIRVPSARQLVYHDKRAHPKGKVPDDVWQYSRVCGTFKERLGNHPCQMPQNLLERIVQTSSNVGDLVLDPFGGTGTTAKVAQSLNRKYISIEKSEEYYELILKRLKSDIQAIGTHDPIAEEQQGVLFDI